MNIQEILEDIDLLVPNAFSLDQKINWLNQAQYQIFKELENPNLTEPQNIYKDNLNFVPWLPIEYHELFSLGVAKRIAERLQRYDVSAELQSRFYNLLMEAKQHTVPEITKVTMVRGWR